MGHSPLSVLYSVPVPQLQLSQDELFAFRFDQLRQRLHNHLSAEHMTAYQRQQQKIIFDKQTGRTDPLQLNDLVLLWDKPIQKVKVTNLNNHGAVHIALLPRPIECFISKT